MKQFSIIILCFIFTASAAFSENKPPEERLQHLLNGLIDPTGDAPIHNVTLMIEAPNFKWNGSAGKAGGGDEAMTPNHTYKIASQTKTMTAVLILQLMEEKKLNLNDPLDRFFSEKDAPKIDQLLIYDGKSYGPKITIKELLTHCSGLADYIFGDKRFLEYVFKHPQTQWNPKKIFEKYFEYELNTKAKFPPGKGEFYSDTNYALLAMIIEKITGNSYHTALRTHIFDPLEMRNTYLEFYEPRVGDAPSSHTFFGKMDLADLNTSFDWGGGGVVSNNEDISKFMKGLFKGKLFQKSDSLKRMTKEKLGIVRMKVGKFEFMGHDGVYRSLMYYDPKKELLIAGTLNQGQAQDAMENFTNGMFRIIQDLRR